VVVKGSAPRRSILHIDLDPFFVSVERSLDPSLRGRPVVVGGGLAGRGLVAAASGEARALGVRAGQSLAQARLLCPEAVVRPGDLEAYARVSEQVTSLLLSASRRVERPSADEAYVDMTPDSTNALGPVAAAEWLKDELQRRLGLDASLGLAGSRLAARTASGRARPRGLLIVLPGYEDSFLARQPIDVLPELPGPLERALLDAGFSTLGSLTEAGEEKLTELVGRPAATRLLDAVHGEGEPPIPVATPPGWVQEEAVVRDRRSDQAALMTLIEGLAARACRRLRPFGLAAGGVSVEVERQACSDRRSESLVPPGADEATIAQAAARLALPLLDPPSSVRAIHLRLTRLGPPTRQAPLFPEQTGAGAGGGRGRLL
jgi:DNA polymerase IV